MTRVFLMPDVPSHPQAEVPMKTSTAPSVLHTQQKLLLTAVAVALFISQVAHGAGAGMPWTGPVAKIAGVAAVVLTGLGMAFSEGGSGMRKLVTVAFGLTIAFAATTFFLPLFGYAGGAAF
jgi:type IV secretory pathway VirB2 component (pilin)